MSDHQMTGVGRLKVFIGAVVEEKVGPPEITWCQPDVRDVVVVRSIPHHVGVLPRQIKPHVGSHDLIFLI